MRTLGAILAGGRSTRYGSDKALAMLGGKPLIEHAVAALTVHVDTVVICGRPWRDLISLTDLPTGGCGPLAGLNAALRHARENDFDRVVCAPIDVHPLADALDLLADAPCAVLGTQWTIGHWPASLAPALDRHLASGARSVRSWLQISGARRIDDTHLKLRNVNFAEDLRDPSVSATSSG